MAKINCFSQLLLLSLIGIHFNTNGNHLAQKPVPLSEAKVPKEAKEVKRIYNSQIGVKEQGNNGGPAVEKYLNYVGLGKGNPWCAAFVCWVYGQAGVTNPHTGWSPHLFPAKKVIWTKGKQLKAPAQADIFALYFADKGRIAHTGFIDNWDGTWLITVEGNTNTQGSREGDGVHRKRRLVKSIYQVARYVNSAAVN